MRPTRLAALTLAALAAAGAMALPAPAAAPPPQVSITSGPPERIVVRGSRTATATWEFATDRDANLTCKFTGQQIQPCSSPRTYSGLLPGKYKFAVYSADPRTDLALTTAKQQIKVVKAKKR